jgi:hypothetical protein
MSKIKELDKSMYKSVEDAIQSLLEKHRISDNIYTTGGLESILSFLCINNIGHTYSKTDGANLYQLVSLTCDEVDETIYWYEQKEEGSYYLIRYADNYEDEFEVSGFVVLTSKEMNDFDTALNVLETIMESTELSFYFGTNEEMVYDDFKFFLEAISVSVLSKSEGAFMLKQFGKSYGTHPYFHIMDLVKNYKEDANDKV